VRTPFATDLIAGDGSTWQKYGFATADAVAIGTEIANANAALAASLANISDGTAASPGFKFSLDLDTGFYRPGDNQIGIVTNGVQRALLSNTALNVSVPITGTAVTQTDTDTTAGRLLKVGDLGLGAWAVPIVTDYDALTVTGFYRNGAAAVGAPPDVSTLWSVLNMSFSADSASQLALRSGGTSLNNMWFRRKKSGTWQPWAKVFHSENLSITPFAETLLDDTTASDARTSLGLGTIATQASSAVSITGGSIVGITDLAVADGGTGSSTAAGARTNLGLGTIATQNANAVAVTGGAISGVATLAATGDISTSGGAFISTDTSIGFFSDGVDPVPMHRLPGRVFGGDSNDFLGATAGNNGATGSWVQTGDEGDEIGPIGPRLRWVEVGATAIFTPPSTGSGTIAITGASKANATKAGLGIVGVARNESVVATPNNAWAGYFEGVRGAGATGGATWALETGSVNFNADAGGVTVKPSYDGGNGANKGILINAGAGNTNAFPADVAFQVRGLFGVAPNEKGAQFYSGLVFSDRSLVPVSLAGMLPNMRCAVNLAPSYAHVFWNSAGDAASAIFGDGSGALWAEAATEVVLRGGGHGSSGGINVKANGAVHFNALATAPASPTAGDVYYDGALAKMRVWDGTAWRDFTGTRGSNANGEYVKFADGTMICTKTLTAQGPINTASGSIFVSAGIDLGALPATFAAVPVRSVSTSTVSTNTCWWQGSSAPGSATGGFVQLVRATSYAGTDAVIQCTFTGRWF